MDYIIIGNGGFAKECFMYLKLNKALGQDINILGFLSVNNSSGNLENLQHMLIGDLSNFNFTPNIKAIIGTGNPKYRKEIYDVLKSKNINMPNLTHNSTISDDTVLGDANIIINNSFISIHCSIGNGNLFNGNVTVGHDAKIGDFNFFAPNSLILGSVVVGNLNNVGSASCLLPKSKIGNNNTIAPLSGVYKGCKDDCYMLGNPALIIK